MQAVGSNGFRVPSRGGQGSARTGTIARRLAQIGSATSQICPVASPANLATIDRAEASGVSSRPRAYVCAK